MLKIKQVRQVNQVAITVPGKGMKKVAEQLYYGLMGGPPILLIVDPDGQIEIKFQDADLAHLVNGERHWMMSREEWQHLYGYMLKFDEARRQDNPFRSLKDRLIHVSLPVLNQYIADVVSIKAKEVPIASTNDDSGVESL